VNFRLIRLTRNAKKQAVANACAKVSIKFIQIRLLSVGYRAKYENERLVNKIVSDATKRPLRSDVFCMKKAAEKAPTKVATKLYKFLTAKSFPVKPTSV
jgi:hypothetical protein